MVLRFVREYFSNVGVTVPLGKDTINKIRPYSAIAAFDQGEIFFLGFLYEGPLRLIAYKKSGI